VALGDALGDLTRSILLPGHRHDGIGGAPLLAEIDFAALIADKAFDPDRRRAELDERGAVAVTPPEADRARRIPCDCATYRWRHLVENFFRRLEAFRRIAARHGKADASFGALIHLVGSSLALKSMSTDPSARGRRRRARRCDRMGDSVSAYQAS
jgi:transposase